MDVNEVKVQSQVSMCIFVHGDRPVHPAVSITATGHPHPGARDRRGEEKAAWDTDALHGNVKLPFRLAAEPRLLTDFPCLCCHQS